MIELVLLFSIAILFSVGNQEITAYAAKENPSEKIEFKIITKAVCEEKSEHIFCYDKMFAKCNGKEYAINNSENIAECGDIKINLSGVIVNGSTKFSK